MVTVLTVLMIVGVAVIIALLVIRLQRPVPLALPEVVTLPPQVKATAFTRGPDWIAVVTDDNRIFIYDSTGETVLQEITVDNN